MLLIRLVSTRFELNSKLMGWVTCVCDLSDLDWIGYHSSGIYFDVDYLGVVNLVPLENIFTYCFRILLWWVISELELEYFSFGPC